MCRDLVARAVDDEAMLKMTPASRSATGPIIAASWKRGDPSLYGRFDLSYDGQGPAKLLEYNADTPTSLYETGVFQWMWLEDAIGAQHRAARCRPVQFAAREADRGLDARSAQGRRRAGHLHRGGALDDPGRRRHDAVSRRHRAAGRARHDGAARWTTSAAPRAGVFVDLADKPIQLMFKLYPWEWMFREQFGGYPRGRGDPLDRAAVEGDPLQQGHPAAFVGDASAPPELAARLSSTATRRPPNSATRSSESRSIRAKAPTCRSWSAARRSIRTPGPTGPKALCARRSRRCRSFEENYAALGSWIVAGQPCGLSVREDASPITKNTSRFLPHAIVG